MSSPPDRMPEDACSGMGLPLWVALEPPATPAEEGPAAAPMGIAGAPLGEEAGEVVRSCLSLACLSIPKPIVQRYLLSVWVEKIGE
jgi:hypothetical protein